MTTSFELLKNGMNAKAVWANPQTKEIYPANRNSFGWNACAADYGTPFYEKYGRNMKINQGRGSNYRNYYYSARSMQEMGFKLVMRGENPLW